ncbi:Zn-dependent hydrolase [Paracoccus sulfuroxidans]|uniref:N-carbamoyl-L-amino-acid hydrolase n=1 Tax=Paracoccus sulfuroxidans TaxID=384678 RepID=A0A562P124_9RHOB|nr:Zn-dependent hydrolase [Paracoccus sulfuroxidans]TWI38033.1 N-carbamoyl-L-amino-acid hydrolase [Paracoccus sulfuroxidans]
MTNPASGTAPAANMKVDQARLWDSLMEMAKIGPGIAGGNNRQTLTDEDGEARHLFQRWCEDAGMVMTVDQMGNMFMRHEGEEPDLDPVYIGSHLDTQPTGGKYDGVLGVLAGLEVIRSIHDLGVRTRRPIVVTNWTNEEGSRFAPAMMASGVFAGVIERDHAYARTDAHGLRFGDELERIGWKGEEVPGDRKIHAMFEYHIEQGPILEAEGKDIGIVTHGQGLRWIECTVTGKGQHTGSTPMRMRRNAGRGLAQLTELAHEIAMKHQPNAVGAIGHIDVYPNSRNIIPEKVVFTVDLRSHLLPVLLSMTEEFLSKAPAICEALGCSFEAQIVGQFDPPAFDETLLNRIREASDRLGYSRMDVVSGAGHDACWINKVAPTVMIMCPCVDGLSHNEAEEISPEWASAGADVLLHAVLETAEIVT